MKPIIAFLRRMGVRIVIYLDDMILMNQSSHMLLKDLTSLRWLLENLGFLINCGKSAIIPVQKIQFLGYLIDSVKMMRQDHSYCREMPKNGNEESHNSPEASGGYCR